MKGFAASSGIFIAGILLVSGYVMAYWHGDEAFFAPFLLAAAALVGLPLLYWLKATRKLPRPLARTVFAAMLGGIATCWLPLLAGWQDSGEFGIPLVIFSAVWLVAGLPILRAGIRHRP
ncbi:hypothetical protein K3152_08860 [Qipengyuania sp. 1NDH17]|uniref:DUF4175 domain-containing protein n=1 Tax=Qipengyuania polymorpha TaxID=2867234 RepID=A0ABS7IY70_9SPHN|nr:hypothetical protein [Qipengyuania polymorpha]MBX7458353.1 hypothetical protein [Qipengyuania polymorpha]